MAWLLSHYRDIPNTIKESLNHYDIDDDATTKARVYLRLIYLIALMRGRIAGNEEELRQEKTLVRNALLEEETFSPQLLTLFDNLAAELARRR